jgi:acetolactate synthase-1/2/3 large subunit
VTTVAEALVSCLEALQVDAAFGVVSIHNMPILDAIHRRGRMRFVPARGEAGAVSMADAYARASGKLGVVVTSTGTAAANAAGGMVEARTAGTPLLHLTGQVDSPYLDRDLGFLHEATHQLTMLKAVSKAAFRLSAAEETYDVLDWALKAALTPPCGPVSVEIPIDVQRAAAAPQHYRLALAPSVMPSVGALAERLLQARRPLLWLGGGARHAGEPVRKLLELGFGAITSVQGRGVVPEDHPRCLGAFQLACEGFLAGCDALLVVGSRLRSNETLAYRLTLPRPLYRIDAEETRAEHPYKADIFVVGDACAALEALAQRLSGLRVDPVFGADLQAARAAAHAKARAALGPYAALVDELQRLAGREFVWVRDVTISNSTWGNRLLRLYGPRNGVHPVGGGIGLALPMAIGAALGAPRKKILCLVGDGGLQLSLGELATLAQEKGDVVVIVMNDRGYGVIRNIWDAHYDGRRAYTELHTPDFNVLARSLQLAYHRVAQAAQFAPVLEQAFAQRGPVIVEVDMVAIGPYPVAFAGPPVRKEPA